MAQLEDIERRSVREDRGYATPCRIWQGATNGIGYGRIRIDGRSQYVHRVAFGPVPEGHEIDHLCGQRACNEPTHLQAVTHRENLMRGSSPSAIHARKTHCPKGHPYSGDNLCVSGGGRICRRCARERMRARRQAPGTA